MKKTLIILLIICLPISSISQRISFSSCNELSSSTNRNACLEASLENLILKETFKNIEFINVHPEKPLDLSVILHLSKNGFFSLRGISTPSFGLAKSVDNVMKNIAPLSIYKDEKNKVIATEFQFDYRFEIQGDSSVIVFKNGNEVLLKRNLLKEREKAKEEEITVAEKNTAVTDAGPEKDPNETKTDDVPFTVIENVPVFPGCEGLENNKAFKDCMSREITAMVINNFNLALAGMLDLSGRQRISVQFKIDGYGFVTDVLARAPHPDLEEEAKRVVNLLPRFTPGKQRGEVVGVLYALPIIFNAEGNKKTKK